MTKSRFQPLRAAGAAVVVSIGLMACASSGTGYTVAKDEGDYGYSESRLSDTRYRVSFSGNSNTPVDLVQDYALLRAAELATENDYQWFEVVERVTMPEILPNSSGPDVAITAPPPISTSSGCGLLGCKTARYSSAYSVETIEPPRRRQKYSTSLEIVLGAGENPDRVDVYNAVEILAAVDENS